MNASSDARRFFDEILFVLRKLKTGNGAGTIGWVGRTFWFLAPKGSEMGNEYDQQQKGAISERVSEHGPLALARSLLEEKTI